MRTVTLCYGLPASGKSTWAKEEVKLSEGKIVRVNMDDIRAMLALPYSKDAEAVALKVQDQAILSAIKAGKDVIVDNTHIEQNMPKRIKQLFDGDVLFKVKDFTSISVATCVSRDEVRPPHSKVGEDIIRRMAGRLSKNSWKLTEEWMNDYAYPLEPYTPDPESSLCVVFDIDGTLAKHNRSPYDYSRLHTDDVFEHIQFINFLYWKMDYSVFIVSGRPDTYRAETEKWLKDNRIKYDHLFMRRADDNRNDADVKHEIFNTEFRDQYEIEAWFDDRDRVVRRMRKLGVNVLQVNDGDF